ncbi:MAG: hypothetical protein JNK65_05050 [Deltaproteobacteria bacterium]|nr:hypothetical protein [Deltaproteobacteria bacterium]
MTRIHADFSSSSLLSHLSHTSLFVERGDETEQAIDRVTSDFAQQLSPIHLVPLLGATAIGRFAQLGARVALQPSLGFLTPLFSTSFSLTVEAATFEGLSRQIHPNPTSFSQGFTNSLITFSSFRTANFFGAPNLFLSHLFQDTAQVVSHSLCENLELTPRNHQSLWLQFLEAERSTLQIETSLRFFHHLFPNYQAFEHSTGLYLSEINRSSDVSFNNLYAHSDVLFAFAGSPNNINRPFSERLIQNTYFMSRLGKLTQRHETTSSRVISSHDSESIYHEFLFRLRPENPQEQNFAQHIIGWVLALELPHSTHYRFMLEALAAQKNRGTLSQDFTLRAIKEIFSGNPIETGCEGFEQLLIQVLIIEGLQIPQNNTRTHFLRDVFETMYRGSSRKQLYRLFEQLPEPQNYRLSSDPSYPADFSSRVQALTQESWKAYRSQDRPYLLNFVYQVAHNKPHLTERIIRTLGEVSEEGKVKPEQAHRIIDFAISNPVGQLVLYRFLQDLITDEPLSRLQEISEETHPAYTEESFNFVQRRLHEGADIETIAREINSTRHNAYFDDLRVARKIVLWLSEVHESIKNPEWVRARRRDYENQITQWINQGRPVEVSDYLKFLRKSFGPHFLKSFEHNIISPSEESFNDTIRLAKLPVDTDILYMEPPNGYRGEKIPQILIRPISDTVRSNRQQYASALRERLIGLIHESDHYRHFNGLYEGIEQGAPAFNLRNISREQRLMTEVMAYIEELRWQNRNNHVDNWSIARRFGQSIPLMFRNTQDRAYFKGVKSRLLREFFENE